MPMVVGGLVWSFVVMDEKRSVPALIPLTMHAGAWPGGTGIQYADSGYDDHDDD